MYRACITGMRLQVNPLVVLYKEPKVLYGVEVTADGKLIMSGSRHGIVRRKETSPGAKSLSGREFFSLFHYLPVAQKRRSLDKHKRYL